MVGTFVRSRVFTTKLPLSANVVLTSTPSCTKPPAAADLVPLCHYELLRSRTRLQVQHQTTTLLTKQWFSICAFLISMPCLYQRASQHTPHRTRPDVSSSAHSSPQTIRMPEHAALGPRRCRHPCVAPTWQGIILRVFLICYLDAATSSALCRKDAVSLPSSTDNPARRRSAAASRARHG